MLASTCLKGHPCIVEPPAYCKDLDRAALTRALAAAEPSRVNQHRAEGEAAAKKCFAEQAAVANRAAG